MKQQPADYRTILETGVRYTDNSFPANDMVYWNDFRPPTEQKSLKDEYELIQGFDSIFETYPSNTLFGVNGVDV